MRFYAWTIRWAGGMQTSKGIYFFLWSIFFLLVKYFRFFGGGWVGGDLCFLNSKTVGFKLEALEKLRQIKSNSGESIEQYVAHQVRVLTWLHVVVNAKIMYICMYVCMFL